MNRNKDWVWFETAETYRFLRAIFLGDVVANRPTLDSLRTDWPRPTHLGPPSNKHGGCPWAAGTKTKHVTPAIRNRDIFNGEDLGSSKMWISYLKWWTINKEICYMDLSRNRTCNEGNKNTFSAFDLMYLMFGQSQWPKHGEGWQIQPILKAKHCRIRMPSTRSCGFTAIMRGVSTKEGPLPCHPMV